MTYLGPPTILERDVPPMPDDLIDHPCMKYADVKFVLANSHPWVRSRIHEMLAILEGEVHTRRVVDVKFWPNLEAGKMPALPHWHQDCVPKEHDSRHEVHVLYMTGAGCRTQFLATPTPEDTDPSDYPIWTAPEGRYIMYERKHLHRATPATLTGRRLLIRVTATDIIRPSRTFYTPMNREEMKTS